MLVTAHGRALFPGHWHVSGLVTGPQRLRTIGLVAQALPPHWVEQCGADVHKVAAEVEMCILAFGGSSHKGYATALSRVLWNLRENGNHIVTTYPPSVWCALSYERLRQTTAVAERDAAIEASVKQLLADAAAAAAAAKERAKTIKTTNAQRCPGCKTDAGLTTTGAQLRAGDEGMDAVLFCSACKRSFVVKQAR